MWSWIFKVSIVSFLFIFLLHYLYSFFKTTLTSPKIKDLVNKPMRKYDSIYDSLQNNQSYIEETEGINISNSLHSNNLYTQNPVKQNMKDELKKYLSELSGSGGNKVNDNNSNVGATSMENYTTTPSIPDFAMSNMSSSSSSSSSFSSSYAEY
jgi:hypothetical protein